MPELEAGRELDALVLTTIFEWARGAELVRNCCPLDTLGYRFPDMPAGQHSHPPAYSTNIAAAWLVVEHIHGRVVLDHWYGDRYKVMIYVPSAGRPSVEAEAETAPLAICRVALAAIAQPAVRGL